MTEFHWQFYMLSILGNLRRRKRPHHGCTLRDPLRCLEPRSCAGAAQGYCRRRPRTRRRRRRGPARGRVGGQQQPGRVRGRQHPQGLGRPTMLRTGCRVRCPRRRRPRCPRPSRRRRTRCPRPPRRWRQQQLPPRRPRRPCRQGRRRCRLRHR